MFVDVFSHRPGLRSIAAHVWKQKHAMDHKPVLLKQAANKQELTNWENILITKNKDHIINFEIPPADHLNPVEGSRSAPTRISNQNLSVMGWQWGQCPGMRFLYIQISSVLWYKQIPIIYRTSLLQNSLKVIIKFPCVCLCLSSGDLFNFW